MDEMKSKARLDIATLEHKIEITQMFFRNLWLIMIFWEEIVPGSFILSDGKSAAFAKCD